MPSRRRCIITLKAYSNIFKSSQILLLVNSTTISWTHLAFHLTKKQCLCFIQYFKIQILVFYFCFCFNRIDIDMLGLSCSYLFDKDHQHINFVKTQDEVSANTMEVSLEAIVNRLNLVCEAKLDMIFLVLYWH